MLEKYFGGRDFWNAVLRLAIPIAFQNLLTSSFTLVDTIMIGQLGEVPLAAVGMAGQWSWLLNIVLFGFMSGASVFIAQYWGTKDMPGIQRTYGLLLVCAAAGGLLFMLVGLCAPGWVLGLFTQEVPVAAEGVAYLQLAALSFPAIALNQTFTTLLRSTEQVKLPMYVTAISVAANAVLNATFIFGLGMGVRGAALATAISAWISPLVLFAVALKTRNIMIAPAKRLFHWTGEFIGQFLRISLPVLLNESLWAVGTVGYNILYGNVDTQFYAALTIFRSIENIGFVFFVGLCHACAVLVGKKVGSGLMREAVDDGRRFTFVAIAFSLLVGGGVIALRDVIMLAFNVSATVNAAAHTIMLCYGLELWLRNIPYILIVGVFRAGGDTRTGLKYDILCVWLLALPLSCLGALVFKWELTTVYLVMLLAEDLPKVLLCLRRFRSRAWLMPVTDQGRQALEQQ